MFLKVPWYYKAGASALLCLFLIGECHARDKAIANAALWQTHWSESVAARKISGDSLKAATDRVNQWIALSKVQAADFKQQLAKAKAHGSAVIVLHDTVQGVPPTRPETVLVADLPIVKACTQSLFVDSVALSSCETFKRFAQVKFLQDSAAIKLALGKPHGSVTRTFGYGVAAGATALLLIHLFWK